MTFYIKDKRGEYIPISFENICFNNWNNKLIIIKVEQKNEELKLDEIQNEIIGSNAFDNLNNASILVIPSEIQIDILGDLGKEDLLIKFPSKYTWFEINDFQIILQKKS